MPSIFNHQNNACWGVQKSYNLFGDQIVMFDDPYIQKYSSISSSSSTVNTDRNFNGSSNGYDGSQIPQLSNLERESNDFEMHSVCSTSLQNNDNVNCRKRCHPTKAKEESKRCKHEETSNSVSTETEIKEDTREMDSDDRTTHHQYYRCNNEIFEEYSEVANNININRKEEELEFLETYLRLTHGCDLYNFHTNDL